MSIIVSADCGKENTQLYGDNKSILFKSRVVIDEEVIAGVEGKTFNIVVDGVLYKVGEGVSNPNYDVSKYSNFHKVCVLAGLCILNINEPVKLVTGTPINLFFTEERLELQKSYVGSYDVIFNGVPKRIIIESCLVVAEGMGVIYNNFSKYKDKLVKVIDIGGLNTNGAIFRHGKPVRDSIFTLNEGVNVLSNKVRNSLNREGRNYQPYEVDYLLEDEANRTELEDIIIRDCIFTHLESVKTNMKANNWNIESGEIVFTGGGSILLKTEILDTFKNGYISEEALWDNCKGFYRIGVNLL